ncbi:hypothetical protein STEG23_026468 [Scotinomys teguina]
MAKTKESGEAGNVQKTDDLWRITVDYQKFNQIQQTFSESHAPSLAEYQAGQQSSSLHNTLPHYKRFSQTRSFLVRTNCIPPSPVTKCDRAEMHFLLLGIFVPHECSGWLFQLSLEVPPPLMFPMTVTPLEQDQDCSLKNQELDVLAPLVPGSWRLEQDRRG